ncbi:hypothetical protein M3Y99_00385000 [Aphelenchoides fujianensis]|nr:hypothetical protein M3Y99_00385000 [Aphelenchoides fujianensis]
MQPMNSTERAMLAAPTSRCRIRRRPLLLISLLLFCCFLPLTNALIEDEEEMMERRMQMVPEEMDFEVDEEMNYRMQYYLELAERRRKIERAVTPSEILENSTLYYLKLVVNAEMNPGVPLLMPGKFITLEHDVEDPRPFTIHLKLLTHTAIDWKWPKSKNDYKRDFLDSGLLNEEEVDDVLGEGFMMLTDFFGMHLQELHIYETDAEVAILRKQIAARQAKEQDERPEEDEEEEELEDGHIEEEDGLPAFDLDFDPHDGEL